MHKQNKQTRDVEFFFALPGVGLVTRKMGNAVSPVVELNKDGEEYVLTSNSTFKNMTTKFKPGVEFDTETPDGRKVKSTFNVDGNALREVQKGADGKLITIDRTFTPDEIKMVQKLIKKKNNYCKYSGST